MKRMKRKVISVRNYIDPHANGTKGTNVLLLECGHDTSRKGSAPIPEIVNCKECEGWANGTTVSKSAGRTIETWDAEKQMPVFTKQAAQVAEEATG